MRMNDREKKWEETDIRNLLEESASDQQIPQSLLPHQMEERLRQQTTGQKQEQEELYHRKETKLEEGRKKNKYLGWWCGTFAAAACMAVALFAVGRNLDWNLEFSGDTCPETAQSEEEDAAAMSEEGTTYQKLYQNFDKVWAEQEKLDLERKEYAVAEDADTGAAAGEADTGSAGETADAAADMAGSAENNSEDYGKTNQQEESVEEADIIKNDGRYLYQAIYQKSKESYTVRIADTKDGLTEAARVGEFDEIDDIYVWKDKLIVLEPGWAENSQEPKEEQTEYLYEDNGESGFMQILKNKIEEVFHTDSAEDLDLADVISGYAFCRIYIYDITDRCSPQEYHTFTVKGNYMESRISDGYLYFFTSCGTSRPGRPEDLGTYVPMLDGKPMAEEKITLPEDSNAASYLVMASVDLERPDSFVDTRALVTSADRFYVSQSSIYVTDSQYLSYGRKGEHTDSTKIFRYSYKDGRMNKEAEGSVKGTLRDDMAMNEYQDYLRMVTTVESSDGEEVIDDISGEIIGYDTSDVSTTNSLYVLDQNLQVAGKIEDLAKGERIYSARFMGDAGYFVTFRETDPLFSADLSNPRQPKILGELKISGFSEYLHFYSKDLLLGIGMEADENTGETRGMKISMFDISNPADVREQSKINLPEYDYSDALYNYKAVLIDPQKNLFGFSAEGYGDNYEQAYLLFTYENGEFRQILKIDCSDEEHWGGWTLRGTYIKDRFFLLEQDGRIEEYSLTDKNRVRGLEP